MDPVILPLPSVTVPPYALAPALSTVSPLTTVAPTLVLPERLSSLLPNSELELVHFTGSESELLSLYGLLADQRLWVDGYDLSGRLVDITDSKALWTAIQELWLAEGVDLMVIRYRDSFYGVTGVLDWDVHKTLSVAPLGLPWTVLTGRTLLSPDLWGSTANTELKLMIYEEIFQQGAEIIEFNVSASNLRSLGAARKFGFIEVDSSLRFVEDGTKEFVRFQLSRDHWESIKLQQLQKLQLRVR